MHTSQAPLAHIPKILPLLTKIIYALFFFVFGTKYGYSFRRRKIKIYILRILCKKPDVLLLDEPSNDIDLNTLDWLEHFILEWDKAVLFVSHDEILLERTANKIIHLEQLKKKKAVRHTVKNVDYETYVKERAV